MTYERYCLMLVFVSLCELCIIDHIPSAPVIFLRHNIIYNLKNVRILILILVK